MNTIKQLDGLIEDFDAATEDDASFEECAKFFRKAVEALNSEARMAMREAIMNDPCKGLVNNTILSIIDELEKIA